MTLTDELRQYLASAVGLNWETLQTSIREAAFPQPPYKEPLLYLLYPLPEIPWRQCGKVAERLAKVAVGFPPLSSESETQVDRLTQDLSRAYVAHHAYPINL